MGWDLGSTPDDATPLGGRERLAVLVVFAVAAMALGSVQASKPGLIATDGWYHTRVAELTAEHGLLRTFPWTQASLYRDHYVDTEPLFHLLLVPFLGRDLILGPKILTVLLGAAVFAVLAWMMLRRRLPYPWLWLTIALTAGAAFTFRMSLTRPHLLSLLLVLLFVEALLRRSPLGILVVSVLYPLSYAAAHLLPAIAVLYALAAVLRGARLPWRILGLVLAGTLLGLLLHPNRAHYAEVWWAINVGDLSNARLLTDQLAREFEPVLGTGLVWDTGLALPMVLAAVAALVYRRGAVKVGTLFLGLLTVAFFVLYLRYQRFVLYCVPLGTLFAAFAAGEVLPGFDLGAWAARHRRLAPAGLALLLSALSAQAARSLMVSQTSVAAERSPRYVEAARWLAANVPAGDTVFTCTWASVPMLLHFAPNARYLNVLSPNLMLAWDPQAFALWRRIARGEDADAVGRIRDRFGARFVLVEKDVVGTGLYGLAAGDPRLALVYEDGEAAIFASR